MKRKRLPKIKTVRAKLWQATKTIVRAREFTNGGWYCFTCNKRIVEPKKAHTGHLFPRVTGGLLLYYNLDALRVQCDTCNRHRGGEGALFFYKLMQQLGLDTMVTLLGLIGQEQKPTRVFFQTLLDERISMLK